MSCTIDVHHYSTCYTLAVFTILISAFETRPVASYNYSHGNSYVYGQATATTRLFCGKGRNTIELWARPHGTI